MADYAELEIGLKRVDPDNPDSHEVQLRFSQPGSQSVIAPISNTKTLASGSLDSAIILWDLTSSPPTSHTLPGHSKQVLSVAFSPDGKRVASGRDDYTIVLWDVDPEAWKESACRMANRNMTKEEWNEYMPADTSYHKTFPNLPVGEGVTLTPTAKP